MFGPGTFRIVPAAGPAPSPARSTAKLMKSGVTTSYRTGDDKDVNAGRGVDFFTLAENNPFGNTLRFTGVGGTSTITNDIVLDWSTYDGSSILGWYRVLLAAADLDTQIANISALSVGGFTGWHMNDIVEHISIWNYSSGDMINYAPFNIVGNQIWTNTPTSSTTTYFTRPYLGATILNGGNGSSYFGLACRYFTVTGTTLS